MNRPFSGHAHRNLHRGAIGDEDLADHVWEAWDMGEIDDKSAAIAWLLIAIY